MLQSIEEVYKNGNIQLSELPSNVSESRVILTFLQPEKSPIQKQIMRFGMFSENKQSTKKTYELHDRD
ncbi:hypothetical protein [Nostoc sp. ChiSLP03a]|uniref:hypothetical protein n=1 Tax=Nostoc sp. ChiSLP03a TaxID=3075380 RepID=UPI002AD1DD46|nr:hypothetical protein [Nostoc sp. ChiSLP03a]MDZ8214501.1 hypothetical protein [Nostoc sp. ChiSLP03a]